MHISCINFIILDVTKIHVSKNQATMLIKDHDKLW